MLTLVTPKERCSNPMEQQKYLTCIPYIVPSIGIVDRPAIGRLLLIVKQLHMNCRSSRSHRIRGGSTALLSSFHIIHYHVIGVLREFLLPLCFEATNFHLTEILWQEKKLRDRLMFLSNDNRISRERLTSRMYNSLLT